MDLIPAWLKGVGLRVQGLGRLGATYHKIDLGFVEVRV